MCKPCAWCKYLYCKDSSDVSGLDCEKNPVFRITNPNQEHPLCFEFKFSLWKYLFGL